MAKVPAKRWATRADLLSQLDEARVRIEENPATAPDLAELAQTASLSKHHFLRLFRSSFGYTPNRYVALRRIGIAKNLLQNTTKSVTDIALLVGCETPSSFTRLFRSHTGMTPSAWRRTNSNFGKV